MEDLREQYEKAQELGKLAFAERPYFGSPGAPAQAETNASQIWGHINAGYLIAYEYTRWWKESAALRNVQFSATGAGSTRRASPAGMPALSWTMRR